MEGGRKQNDKTCRAGCGFFGSSATNGFCSVCYKKELAKQNADPTGGLLLNLSQGEQEETTADNGRASSTKGNATTIV